MHTKPIACALFLTLFACGASDASSPAEPTEAAVSGTGGEAAPAEPAAPVAVNGYGYTRIVAQPQNLARPSLPPNHAQQPDAPRMRARFAIALTDAGPVAEIHYEIGEPIVESRPISAEDAQAIFDVLNAHADALRNGRDLPLQGHGPHDWDHLTTEGATCLLDAPPERCRFGGLSSSPDAPATEASTQYTQARSDLMQRVQTRVEQTFL